MFEDLNWIIWIGLAGFTIYYLGTPLLIFSTYRQAALPDVEPVDDDLQRPPEVLQYFSECDQKLTSEGFINNGTYLLANQTPNVTAILVLFTNEAEKASAMSVVMYGQFGPEWRIATQYTEFCTAFTNGTEINTGCQGQIGSFPATEGTLTTIHPELRDVAVLFAAHKALVRQHQGGRQPALHLHERYQGDVPRYISAVMTEELEEAVQVGYLRHRGGYQPQFSEAMKQSPYQPPADPPSYVATFTGAYLMTWRELWPIKPIRWRRRIKRDRQILEETGFRRDSIS